MDARAAPPALTWVGCAPALSTLTFNGVVALPEGGFAATSGPTGDVWQYQTATGWRRVPGSEGTAPNGMEISKDGRWLYIAGWAEEKVTRLSRGQTPIRKDVVTLGFRPDNLRMSPDGSVLFAAGHTDKDGRSITEPREPLRETSNVATIDQQTLAVRRIFQHPAMDGFVASTTGVQIGDEMWLGSQRGDRIAYFPAPRYCRMRSDAGGRRAKGAVKWRRREILDHHLKCLGAGDLEGILADYAPDAVLFTPDGP